MGSQDIRDGRWLGFQGTDLRVEIDLGAPTAVTQVAVDVLQEQRAWIFFPRSVRFATSADGERWSVVEEVPGSQARESDPAVQRIEASLDGSPVRHLRLDIEGFGPNPEWHAAPGQPSWLFLDEVIVATDPERQRSQN